MRRASCNHSAHQDLPSTGESDLLVGIVDTQRCSGRVYHNIGREPDSPHQRTVCSLSSTDSLAQPSCIGSGSGTSLEVSGTRIGNGITDTATGIWDFFPNRVLAGGYPTEWQGQYIAPMWLTHHVQQVHP